MITIAADCVYEVTGDADLNDGKEKIFSDGTAEVRDDGALVFTFDEPKTPTEIILQLKASPDVTVTLADEDDKPVKTLVSCMLLFWNFL